MNLSKIIKIYLIINCQLIFSAEVKEFGEFIQTTLPDLSRRVKTVSETLQKMTIPDIVNFINTLPEFKFKFLWFCLINIRIKQDANCYENAQQALEKLEKKFCNELMSLLIKETEKPDKRPWTLTQMATFAYFSAQQNNGKLPKPFIFDDEELKIELKDESCWEKERTKLLHLIPESEYLRYLTLPTNHKQIFEIDISKKDCQTCFKITKLRCINCKTIRYCSRECQQQDWKKHKKYCNLVKFFRFGN